MSDKQLLSLPDSLEHDSDNTVVESYVEDSPEQSVEIPSTVQVTLAKRILLSGSNKVLCLGARTSVPINDEEQASVSDLALRLSDGTNVALSLSFFNDDVGKLVPANQVALGNVAMGRISFEPLRYAGKDDSKLGMVLASMAAIAVFAVYCLIPEPLSKFFHRVAVDKPVTQNSEESATKATASRTSLAYISARAAVQRAAVQRTAAQRTAAQRTAAQRTAAQRTAAQRTPAQRTAAQRTAPQRAAEKGTPTQGTAEPKGVAPTPNKAITDLPSFSGNKSADISASESPRELFQKGSDRQVKSRPNSAQSRVSKTPHFAQSKNMLVPPPPPTEYGMPPADSPYWVLLNPAAGMPPGASKEKLPHIMSPLSLQPDSAKDEQHSTQHLRPRQDNDSILPGSSNTRTSANQAPALPSNALINESLSGTLARPSNHESASRSQQIWGAANTGAPIPGNYPDYLHLERIVLPAQENH